MILLSLIHLAAAQDYDIVRDWDPTNSTGPFTYGSWPNGYYYEDEFVPFARTHVTPEGIEGMSRRPSGGPARVRYNPTGTDVQVGAVMYDNDYVAFRPQQYEPVGVRFTAPESGIYLFQVQADSLRTSRQKPASGDFHCYQPGNFSNNNSTSFSVTGRWNDGSFSAGSAAEILNAGDTFDCVFTGMSTDNYEPDLGLQLEVSYDTDGDLVGDDVDNCIEVANDTQFDGDGDGIGNKCENGYLTPADVTVAWDPVAGAGDVTFTVSAPGATGFKVGMVESEYEKCGTYNNAPCHEFTGTTGQLKYKHYLADLVLGKTTLFDGKQAVNASGDDKLTYLLIVEGGTFDGQCYVWGHEPGKYLSSYWNGPAQGCTYWPVGP